MPQSVYNSCPNCLEHTFPVFPLYDQIHLILQILAKISCSKRAFYHLKQFGLWFLPTAPNLLSIVFTMSLLLCLIFVCMPLKYKLIEVRDLLWPPHVKIWLIGKDPDTGRDWGAGGEGDDRGWDGWMASPTRTWSWVGDGQGGLARCDSWGHKELEMTEQLNWTENFWFLLHIWMRSLLGTVIWAIGCFLSSL